MSTGCQCGAAHGACATEFQYAVKIVCGELASSPYSPVAGGQYWTSVNIHNPDKCKDAHYRIKLAQTVVSQYYTPTPLGPDETVIYSGMFFMWMAGSTLSSPPPAFLEGFFVIESDIELDVVAVYTGSTGFHTERVPARCVPVCEDLVLPLHTGFADWRTVTTDAPVMLIPTTGWGAPPLGSKWVSQFAPDTVLDPPPRRYRLSFDLCSGFSRPSPCTLQVQVNDTATVFLNGAQVGATVPLLGTPTPVALPGNASFRAGSNQLEVEVSNIAGQTGFALTGILHVPRGKCPCAKLPIARVPLQGGVFMRPSDEQLRAAMDASRSSLGKDRS